MHQCAVDLNEVKPHKQRVSVIKISLVLMAGFFLLVSPWLPTFAGEKAWSAVAVLFVAIILWLTNLIPPAITSMLVVVLLSLWGILTVEEASGGLGKDVIWLVIAMLIMGVAVEKHSLDKRLAYSLIQTANGSVRLTVLILMLLALFLAFFMPNALGRITVLLPIGLGLINLMKDQRDDNLNKAIILSITLVPYASSIIVLTGAGGSIYTVGLFQSMLGYTWNYLHWFVVMMPLAVLVTLFLWLVLLKIFPVQVRRLAGGQDYFRREIEKLGPISRAEVKLILLYVIMVLLWVTKAMHHISISTSAVLIAAFLFMPGFNLLNWQDAMKKVDWGIPLLFAAGFGLAQGMGKTGVAFWLTRVATRYLDNLTPLMLALIVMVIITLIRIGFLNFTAMAASLMPVVITFAQGTPYNPVWIGMICVVASSTGFFFPTQTIGSITTFSLGYYSVKDYFVAGSLLTVIIIILTLILAFFYWPLVGLNVYA